MRQPSPSPFLRFPTGLGSDVLLWITVALLIGGGVWRFLVTPRPPAQQTLTLALTDANELTRGAIVRMMGVEIGSVSDIAIRRGFVEVTLKTLPRTPPVPAGSRATVLFTGLAGAKSIEITPPAHTRLPPDWLTTGRHLQPTLVVEDTIRLHDASQAQVEIAQALKDGAENFANLFGKNKPVSVLSRHIETTERSTEAIHRNLGETQGFLQRLTRQVDGRMTQLAGVVTAANPWVVEATDTLEQHPPAQVQHTLTETREAWRQTTDHALRQVEAVNRLHPQLLHAGAQAERGKAHLEHPTWRVWLQDLQDGLQALHQGLEGIEGFHKPKAVPNNRS